MQNQHLDIFSADLTFLESSPGSLGILNGSYHMTRGNPSDPED